MQDLLSSISSKFTVEYRLLRVDSFDHVIRAENITTKQFKIFFAGNSKKNARLGIVASKKMLPKAADRNRIKRIIREVFRDHHIKQRKLDLVVMVARDYSKQFGAQIDNLKKLFSQVEDRCAE